MILHVCEILAHLLLKTWISCLLMLWRLPWPGGCFSLNISSYQYRGYHYKDKTVSWLSYLYMGITIPDKTVFILKQAPGYQQVWLHPKLFMTSGSAVVKGLTHWGLRNIADIFLTTYWKIFPWKKMLIFHWTFFPHVQLTISQHWLRWWLGAVEAPSHHLNHWCIYYLLHTRLQYLYC